MQNFIVNMEVKTFIGQRHWYKQIIFQDFKKILKPSLQFFLTLTLVDIVKKKKKKIKKKKTQKQKKCKKTPQKEKVDYNTWKCKMQKNCNHTITYKNKQAKNYNKKRTHIKKNTKLEKIQR